MLLEQKKLTPITLIAGIKEMIANRDSYLKQLSSLPPNRAAAKIIAYILYYLQNNRRNNAG